MPRDENMVFRCPQDLKERVREFAEENDLSMGQVIRKALRGFLEHASERASELEEK